MSAVIKQRELDPKTVSVKNCLSFFAEAFSFMLVLKLFWRVYIPSVIVDCEQLGIVSKQSWETFASVILFLSEKKVFLQWCSFTLKISGKYPCLLSRLSLSYSLPSYSSEKHNALVLLWRGVFLKVCAFGFWFVLLKKKRL